MFHKNVVLTVSECLKMAFTHPVTNDYFTEICILFLLEMLQYWFCLYMLKFPEALNKDTATRFAVICYKILFVVD